MAALHQPRPAHRGGRRRRSRARQQVLPLPATPTTPRRGGRRPGAGRPRKHPLPAGWNPKRRFVPHLRRAAVNPRHPLHVTLRLCRVVRTLRNGKLHRILHGALRASCERAGFRVVHYSIQGDHIHLLVEATDATALSRGMQSLAVRIAKRLNARLRRRGRVLADRFHARALATPTEVRRALVYVLNNARHHAAEQGATYPRRWIDPFSSAADFTGWRVAVLPDPTVELLPRCTADPATWLLRVGWKRAGGLLDPATVPGKTPAPAFDDR